jgi:RNA polymerase sigma-70 factor (ECF subfamily)
LPKIEPPLYLGKSPDSFDGANEDQIVAAFIEGDLKAFRYVYNKYRERIFSYCLYVTGNKILAEDAFQETMIRIYEKREQLREARALKNWLLLVARTVCINLARESKFTPEFIYLDEDPVAVETPNIGSRNEEEFSDEIFQFAFRKIAPIYRDAFLLREIEGFTYEEAAEMTGATVTNVKVRVARAKKMLRAILSPHFKHRLADSENIIEKKEKKEESEKAEEPAEENTQHLELSTQY